MLARLALALWLSGQIVIVSPPPDTTVIRIPKDLSNDVVLCAEYQVNTACIRIGDLRQFLKTRKFAH